MIQVDAAQKEFSSDVARGLAVLHAHTGNEVKGFVLRVDADTDRARGLHLKQGFADSGETFYGRIAEERGLTLALAP